MGFSSLEVCVCVCAWKLRKYRNTHMAAVRFFIDKEKLGMGSHWTIQETSLILEPFSRAVMILTPVLLTVYCSYVYEKLISIYDY